MRTIRKHSQPVSLTQWRIPRLLESRNPGLECNYASLRQSPAVLKEVEDGLLSEQGKICAYTGHRISIVSTGNQADSNREVKFHIEHVLPQEHCGYGQDTDYSNMVACWPKPNCGFHPAYGAKRKDNWPTSVEQANFISPLRPDCSVRFKFDHKGGIEAANSSDAAAIETIEKLGLNHKTLNDLRREAIWGALNPASRPIKLGEAQKLLSKMEQASATLNSGGTAELIPFCWAIEPALRREIRKLQGILAQKRS